MMRRVAPRALFTPRSECVVRTLVHPSRLLSSPASPSHSWRSSLRLGVAALFAGSALAAFIASLESARADEGLGQASKQRKGEGTPQSQQWWTAPTALGKALLLAEECVRVLGDTRDMFVALYTYVRDGTSDTLSGIVHRLLHRHPKTTIPYYLLPPPLPPGAQKPLTLVVELDMLFHAPPERIQRAGFEYFLTSASDFCEIVLVSDQRAKGIFELMQSIDPLGLISFRLSGEHFFDEHAHYHDLGSAPLRDLARLQRDLRHVVVLTSTPERYPRHSENVLYVGDRMWHRDPEDRVLYELVPVLMHLSQQSDVRSVLPRFDGLNVAALMRAHIELDAPDDEENGTES